MVLARVVTGFVDTVTGWAVTGFVEIVTGMSRECHHGYPNESPELHLYFHDHPKVDIHMSRADELIKMTELYFHQN